MEIISLTNWIRWPIITWSITRHLNSRHSISLFAYGFEAVRYLIIFMHDLWQSVLMLSLFTALVLSLSACCKIIRSKSDAENGFCISSLLFAIIYDSKLFWRSILRVLPRRDFAKACIILYVASLSFWVRGSSFRNGFILVKCLIIVVARVTAVTLRWYCNSF